MIRFVCECGKQLQARDENAGKRVRCPACQRQLIVPTSESAAIPAEEAVELPPAEGRVQRQRPIIRDEPEELEDRPRRREPTGSSGKATTSLILGILSVFCNVVTGLPALIVGILALRDIGRSQERLSGRGLAIAGIVSACVGSLLNCGILIPIVFLVPAVGVLMPSVSKVRDAAARSQSQNNLKQMALAMHNYNSTFGSLPPSGIGDPLNPQRPQKQPLLSWRVAILPFIEQQQLYSQFKLDEPWDSPNNIKLLARMPKLYQLPGDETTKPDHTHYQVFVGNSAAFDKTRGFKIPQDFTDGTSNTILIVEAAQAVPWTKPDDIPFDPSKPIAPLLSTYFKSGCQIVLVDGSVRLLKPNISETTLKAAITRNGNEALGPDW